MTCLGLKYSWIATIFKESEGWEGSETAHCQKAGISPKEVVTSLMQDLHG